jgi:hypothetical protein
MDYRNGYRLGGSTATNDPKSTPESDASTPNATQNIDDDHPTPHERTRAQGFEGRPLASTDQDERSPYSAA